MRGCQDVVNDHPSRSGNRRTRVHPVCLVRACVRDYAAIERCAVRGASMPSTRARMRSTASAVGMLFRSPRAGSSMSASQRAVVASSMVVTLAGVFGVIFMPFALRIGGNPEICHGARTQVRPGADLERFLLARRYLNVKDGRMLQARRTIFRRNRRAPCRDAPG